MKSKSVYTTPEEAMRGAKSAYSMTKKLVAMCQQEYIDSIEAVNAFALFYISKISSIVIMFLEG